MWEPEAFRRLDGQAIWVVGSGSVPALEGKVMAPPGLLVLEFCVGVLLWQCLARRGKGKGKVREANGAPWTSWTLANVRWGCREDIELVVRKGV